MVFQAPGKLLGHALIEGEVFPFAVQGEEGVVKQKGKIIQAQGPSLAVEGQNFRRNVGGKLGQYIPVLCRL